MTTSARSPPSSGARPAPGHASGYLRAGTASPAARRSATARRRAEARARRATPGPRTRRRERPGRAWRRGGGVGPSARPQGGAPCVLRQGARPFPLRNANVAAGLRRSAGTVESVVNATLGRAFGLLLAATVAALLLAVPATAADAPRVRRGRVRQRRQPGHAGVPPGRDGARGARAGRGGRDRDGHARRARLVDARDRQVDARARGPGRRLRRPARLERRLRRRRHRPGRRHPRDGAADEHRLVDADLRLGRGARRGPPPQGDQRRRRVRGGARARARAERRGRRGDGADGGELRRPRGARARRDRRDRADRACAPRGDRRAEDRAEGVRAGDVRCDASSGSRWGSGSARSTS